MPTSSSKIKCVTCGNIRELGNCYNCRGGCYTLTSTGNNMNCDRCDRFVQDWKCSCGVVNPTAKTLYTESSCFIATAVYQDPLAPNVITLRNFRDTKLRGTFFGDKFISFYESNSPRIANWIEGTPLARLFVKQLFLSPIISIIRYFF
jgi:hypothetical protein